MEPSSFGRHADTLSGQAPHLGPLAGIKIVDLSHVASGPFATMLLADMGADVIKIERPGQGDGARQMDVSVREGGDSGYFLGLNKNKRSIALDLSTASGVEVVRSLASSADIFVENFRPGAADRMGLGYKDVASVRPDIIYCSITGFGASGSRRNGIAYDIIGQAMSGIMSITGDADRPPAKCGAPIADLTSGMFGALGILAALHHRSQTGEGQHVGASLLGASAALLSSYVTSQAIGTTFERVGSAHNTLAPYQAFQGSDGRYFIVAAANDGFFYKLVDAIRRPDLADDPRFRANPDRSANRAVLALELQNEFARCDTQHWLLKLQEAGVPVSPIQSVTEMVSDDQMRENGYIADIEHPNAGSIPVVVAPVSFSATPVSVRRSPPQLDQHRSEILAIAAARSWSAF